MAKPSVQAAETSWNITLADTSPLFQYTPFGDGSNPQLEGWQNVYSEGSSVTPVNQQWLIGSGISQHVTGAAAQVSLSFRGTGLYLKGGVTGNMKYTVELDGQVTTPTPDGIWLATFKGLANNVEHRLTLRTQPQAQGGWLAIQEAIVQVGSGFTGATMTPILQEQTAPGWQWSSGFAQVTDSSSGKQLTLARSVRAGSWGALTFTGHSVILQGTTNINHGRYAVTLDGQTQVYNATSRHLVSDVVLFQAAGLDTTKQHVLNVTHLDNNPFEVDYATVLSVQGGSRLPATANPTQPSGPNIMLIAGAIGGGVGLLLILGLVWFFLRRRRKQNASNDGERGLPNNSEMAAADNAPPVSVVPPTLPPIAAVESPPSAPRVRFMEELNRVETTSSIISDTSYTEIPPSAIGNNIGRTNTPPAGFVPPSILIRRQNSSDSQDSGAPLVKPSMPAPTVPRIFLTQPNPAVNSKSAWSTDSDSLTSYDSRPTSNGSRPTFSETPPPLDSQDHNVQSLPNPFDDVNAAKSNTLPSARTIGSSISRSTTPQASWELPIPKPDGVINSDLLAALESTSVPSVSRSGTRKVGLPSNPRSFRDLSQP